MTHDDDAKTSNDEDAKTIDRLQKAIRKKLDALQGEDARKKVEAVMDAAGKSTKRPKAGDSF